METSENQKKTYTDPVTGKFIEGNPGGGRPPETEEVKLIKKARRELIEEYKDALAQALPVLSPVLVAKAMEGDVSAIRELHDRVMNKAPIKKELSGPDGGPMESTITISFKDGSPVPE